MPLDALFRASWAFLGLPRPFCTKGKNLKSHSYKKKLEILKSTFIKSSIFAENRVPFVDGQLTTRISTCPPASLVRHHDQHDDHHDQQPECIVLTEVAGFV